MTPSLDPSATADARSTLVPENSEIPQEMRHRLQFSLSSLLILTALMAVGLVLLKTWGHWGLVVITASCFIITLYSVEISSATLLRMVAFVGGRRLARTAQKSRTASGGLLIDLIWGVGLPLLCFAYDPGIILQDSPEASFGEAAIATALWQMVLLLAWLMMGPRGPAWNGAMAGGMIVGSILAGLLAIPFTLLALAFVLALGMGLPGFVPLMTTWVYARNWSLASFLIPISEPARRRYQIAFMASLLLALLAPAFLVWITNTLGLPFHFPRLPQRAAESLLFK